jgi:hypothetical protein
MYFRQAFSADWNCGEAGLAPGIATSPSLIALPLPTAELRVAWSPCALRHVISAALLGLEGAAPAGEVDVVPVVDGRFATDVGFEPPHPARTAIPTRPGRKARTRPDTSPRKPAPSKPSLNRL